MHELRERCCSACCPSPFRPRTRPHSRPPARSSAQITDDSGAYSAGRHRHHSQRRRARRADRDERRQPAPTAFPCSLRAPTRSSSRFRDSARSSERRVPVAVGSERRDRRGHEVGALEEMITVEGAAPVVNAAAAEVSTTYNREWVDNAPTKRFSYFDLVNSSPGVSGDVERRPVHERPVDGQQHEREPVPDRRHQHQLHAVGERRCRRGSRSPAARRVGPVRQRPGRRLQHRHAPGREHPPSASSACTTRATR